jgi:Glycosyltransferase (GlcNAc)
MKWPLEFEVVSRVSMQTSLFYNRHLNSCCFSFLPTDGARCAETLLDLFANARDPDHIIVGLVEQNHEDDPYCLELYCKLSSPDSNLEIYQRVAIRKDVTKVIVKDSERSQCPRIDQIRNIAVHSDSAKGPSWARSLGRKVLGNEEFCLQIDAHSQFIKDWDIALKEQWTATENEFAIISHPPPHMGDFEKSVEDQVIPRHCTVDFLDIQIPVSASNFNVHRHPFSTNLSINWISLFVACSIIT